MTFNHFFQQNQEITNLDFSIIIQVYDSYIYTDSQPQFIEPNKHYMSDGLSHVTARLRSGTLTMYYKI